MGNEELDPLDFIGSYRHIQFFVDLTYQFLRLRRPELLLVGTGAVAVLRLGGMYADVMQDGRCLESLDKATS